MAAELGVTPEFRQPRLIVNPAGLELRAGDSVIVLCMGRKSAIALNLALPQLFAERPSQTHLKETGLQRMSKILTTDASPQASQPSRLLRRQKTKAVKLLGEVDQDITLTKQNGAFYGIEQHAHVLGRSAAKV